MGLFDSAKARAEPKSTTKPIPTGRISSTGSSNRRTGGFVSRTDNLLETLRRTPNVYDAITLICKQHPDASMAKNTMVRLSNSGHQMEMRSPRGGRNKRAEAEWRKFCERVNVISNEGLDGLIDQFLSSGIMYGAMACEAVVEADMSDIEDVYPILPQSVNWEYDQAKKEWIPWQHNGTQKVDLRQGNFFWVAFGAEIGTPHGTLLYESALQPIDNQLQFFSDTAAVMRRVGYPRNDVEINKEAVIASADSKTKNDPDKLKKYLEEQYSWVKSILSGLEPTDDLVHYDDTTINAGNAGDGSRTMDVRAHYETLDPQVLNGLSCLAVLANRTTGVTETWGTVQFKIVTQTILSLQRCVKRLMESVARVWLQVHGYNLTPVFTYNPVDWDAEKVRLECMVKKLEVNRRAEEYGYIDTKTAAAGSMGVSELPKSEQLTMFEYLKNIKKAPETSGSG